MLFWCAFWGAVAGVLFFFFDRLVLGDDPTDERSGAPLRDPDDWDGD